MSDIDTDPVVITGMAVEAPGGIETPEDYWDALADGVELIGRFPRDRGWPLEEMFALGELDGWRGIADAGGFLDAAGEFDPAFYGISRREAIAMDPQQRVGLRVAWKALENSGIHPGSLDGADVGCFVGASPMLYGPPADEVNDYSGHRVVGLGQLGVAARVSHALGLVGPSMCVDSACASSLTALGLAVSAVRSDECEWAIAGAVSVIASPGVFYEFARNHALAIDGHCRAYSEETTGTVWGEGAGMVIVERLSRAQALGHRVLGHIKGVRTNHNGKGKPILVPRLGAQQKLIEKTLEVSGVDPALIGMIEGHGTATKAGDPIELTALQNTYGMAATRRSATEGPLLGSVKSNAGHSQAAAGLMGLIKLLLAGSHGAIPPTLFADTPTSALDWSRTSMRLAAELTKWEAIEGFRYGAVSSFGAGGANAHAIIAMPEHEENGDH